MENAAKLNIEFLSCESSSFTMVEITEKFEIENSRYEVPFIFVELRGVIQHKTSNPSINFKNKA